jgi:hypothetical protein
VALLGFAAKPIKAKQSQTEPNKAKFQFNFNHG